MVLGQEKREHLHFFWVFFAPGTFRANFFALFFWSGKHVSEQRWQKCRRYLCFVFSMLTSFLWQPIFGRTDSSDFLAWLTHINAISLTRNYTRARENQPNRSWLFPCKRGGKIRRASKNIFSCVLLPGKSMSGTIFYRLEKTIRSVTYISFPFPELTFERT